ncbi:hypothetical protein [Pseudomonas sp.]|uniref:hypothetical protein n=1 Tax=Pseudomonas sp. TaxID=306 RepID=UPI0028A69E3A|nr:hypothetical protein [Pseudomonas sp.]
MNQSIDLEAAKAAFFASGGQLVVLEGFTYRPLPERKHPAPSPKKRRGLPPVQSGTRQEKARAKAEMVAELAATMTCREASQALGVPQATLWDLAKRNGFTFVSAARGKHTPKPDDEERDAKLAERIQALRDQGLSRHRATLSLEIGHTTMSRIIKKFGIDFPIKKRRA